MSDEPKKSAAEEQDDQPEKTETPKLRISHAAAGVCGALVFCAVGAALMANHLSSRPEDTRIFLPETSSVGQTLSRTATVTSAPRVQSVTASTALSETVPAEQYSFPADINSADADMLRSVGGISKTVAEGIVSYRSRNGRIHNFEELLDVYGIGERTLTVIKEHFYISEQDHIPAAATMTSAAAETSKATKETTSKVTTQTTETASRTVTSAEAEPPRERRPVNINSADAEELADALLIGSELAEKIVELRTNIGAFSDPRELLLIDGLSRSSFAELFDYLLLEDAQETGKEESIET